MTMVMGAVFKLENHEWVQGEPLGSGGYGNVFAASSNGLGGAIKLVRKAPGAERELLFDLPAARNIVPIIDRGETDTHWALVMPRAEKSLHEFLIENDGLLDPTDALPILLDIAHALEDIDGKVIHRDIKPRNILLLDGHWCLADFGIAKYAEAATATHTSKFAGTPEYIPPERWNNERISAASDIYAFGVVAFEMLSGSTPFSGPELSDFREQHLTVEPPELQGVSAPLAALVDECLLKSADARPTAANLSVRLAKAEKAATSPGLKMLQDANRKEVRKLVEADREAGLARSEKERRMRLVTAGQKIVAKIVNELFERIAESAPMAKITNGPNEGRTLRLGDAELIYSEASFDPLQGQRRDMPLDVVLISGLAVKMPENRSGYIGRSHALWFSDAQQEGQYRWFETAFMTLGTSPDMVPFALTLSKDAVLAVSRTMHAVQVAWPFTPLEVGDLDEFVDRWALWLAKAADRSLHVPANMPERPTEGTWRR